MGHKALILHTYIGSDVSREFNFVISEKEIMLSAAFICVTFFLFVFLSVCLPATLLKIAYMYCDEILWRGLGCE